MDSKDIKYLFRNYNRYKQLIENQKERLQQIRTQAEKITPSYSSDGGGGGKSSKSKVEDNVIKMAEIEQNIDKLQRLVDSADMYRARLKTYQRRIITIALIGNNTLEYVAYLEDTTPENIKKIIKSALKYLERF